jgi:hypothetical protein
MQALLSSSQGGVAKDMLRRGIRVESAAKKNLGSNPKRVDTGRLRASIVTVMVMRDGKPIVRVGTSVKYARFVHDGTGIFGPYSTVIRPKNGKVLKWKSKTYGAKTGKYAGYAFAQYTIGMRPNPFLKNALKAAKG